MALATVNMDKIIKVKSASSYVAYTQYTMTGCGRITRCIASVYNVELCMLLCLVSSQVYIRKYKYTSLIFTS